MVDKPVIDTAVTDASEISATIDAPSSRSVVNDW